MKIKTIASLGIALSYSLFTAAQTTAPVPKQLAAKRTTQKVTIDGKLDEAAWKDAANANGFIEYRPAVGVRENAATKSETYLMYDDEGIYFGGYLYERTKDSISAELRGRDGFGNNDFIGIIFDTYKDNLNGFEYFVTPLNEQMDAKVSPGNNDNGGEDFSWNAVWKSGAVIREDGWSFEMFIPFSAIRFGKADVQNWGLNITRRRQKTGQQYMWNPINPNVNGFLTQEGFWTGVTKIKPPLRLQFSPYFSVYANHYKANTPGIKNWTSQVNGGMDVKYGINQAFTLDATLIPDFGQVQSDNRILNLTPFDVQFNENRAFFTEGTELFSKGGLFYSRRIGVQPVYSNYNMPSTDSIIKDPVEAKLINATKISGRTQKGLGIAMLNAITKPRYATVEDIYSHEQKKHETEPLTNFNVFVLDQTLKNNSSVSLVNTSVLRSGAAYDANVTAALFDFNDKKNTWNLGGKAAVSNLIGIEANGKTISGYSQSLYFGKTSGRFNFNIDHSLTDTKYSHADLGYFTNNNFLNHHMYVGYRWTDPKKWYNRIFLNFNASISNLLSQISTIATKYQRSEINVNGNLQTKKLAWLGLYAAYNPHQNDFYEPRVTGYYFTRGSSAILDLWYESNTAKKYSFYTEVAARKYFKFYNTVAADINISQTYRFSSKFSLSHRINFYPRFNSVGFTAFERDDITGAIKNIIFGRRKINTVEDILSAKYNFTNRMGLTFRARHYVSSVKNVELLALGTNGKLNPSAYNENKNRNLNYFNIDMVYTWQFAPGSFVNIVWKNSADDYRENVEKGYFKNLSNTLDNDQINNLSVKVIYFLDYLQLKNLKKKKA